MPGLLDFLNPSGGLGAQGGFMQRASSFRDQNPGALTALGAGIMSGNPAAGFAGAAPMIAQGRKQNATAQFLLTKGFAQSPEEAMTLAQNPALLGLVLKDPDEFSQRAEAAQRYGLDPKSPEGQAFILSGNLAKPDAGAGMTDDIKEYQYALGSGSFKGSFADWQTKGAGGRVDEYTRKNRSLATVVAPEVKNLLGDGTAPGKFDALASTKDQYLETGGNAVKSLTGLDVANFATSADYQSAKNSLKTIVASYLYSVSGATANPGEVETQTTVLMPRPGEDATSVADKKRRIQTMVDAVNQAAAGGAQPGAGTIPPPDGGWTVEEVPQ